MRELFRLYKYAKPYKWILLFGFSLILLDGLLGTIPPLFFVFVVDHVLATQHITQPELTHEFGLFGVTFFKMTFSPERWLLNVFIAFVSFHAFTGVLSFVRTIVMTWASNRVLFDMRNEVFSHVQDLSMRFFDTQGTGQIMSRITGDVNNLSGLITDTTINIIRDFVMMFAMLFILFSKSWVLSALALSIMPAYILTNRIFVQKMKRVWRLLRHKWAEIYGGLYEAVAGAKVVKAFGQEKHEEKKAFHSMRQTYHYQIRANTLNTAMQSILSLLQSVGFGLVMWWGGRFVVRDAAVADGFTLGAMILFNSYLGRMYGPIMNLVSVNTTIQSALVSSERVFGLLDSEPTVEEKEDAYPLPSIEGRVKFDNVHFSYDPEKPVLRGINFEAQSDMMIALVGPSGCGKTTVINLLARFYDPVDGAILIDGHNLRDVTLRSLRNQIGVVLQESILFKGSIAENIRYGKLDATDQDVVQAAIDANAHKFISEDLAEGYETDVGERGGRLSGGQRQRIAIARTILRDPRLLILDEATSALDTHSEAAIQDALERLMKGRTTFVIAHRLSTVLKADKIIVMKEGQIEEMGPHAELLELDGMYAEMFNKQFRIQEREDDWLKG
ncbi:MAG: ABC transporter ATP-binding protein [Candidatus Poribacteria bacterium]|nr:ABC transporter ATP-binding protein [Candidatus Poribacteria bacterium]